MPEGDESRGSSCVRRFGAPLRALVVLVATVACLAFGARPAQAASCYVATGKISHVLCWLDFTGDTALPLVSGNYTFSLPDGSTLSLTATNTGTTTAAVVATPTYSGAPLGNTAYTGIRGAPAFYVTGNQSEQLSAITLRNPQGVAIPSVGIAAADDETLDTGDNNGLVTGSISWQTTGANWAQLQLMPNGSGSTTTVCTLSGLNSQNAQCAALYGGNNAAYMLNTSVTSTQTITMSDTTGAKQGFAFAVQMASLTASKTIVSRENPSDQFNVSIARGGATIASTTTSGTATTATTTPAIVAPGDTYTFSETATSGTLSNYKTTYACVTTGGTTVASGAATSFTYTAAIDDQVTCTFTNTALKLTVAANTPTKSNVQTNTALTDVFTLTNTSSTSANFNVTGLGATITASAGAAPTVSGYVYSGTTYATLAALQTALAAATPTASGGTITISVQYTSSSVAATDTVTFAATVTSGTGTSPAASATEIDSIVFQMVSIAKTGTTQANPGGPIFYSILVTNTSPLSADGTVVTDPMPTGVTVIGTPTCGSATGGAACGTVTSSSTNVTVTIATLPANGSVTIAIEATAAAGGSFTNTATATPPGSTASPSSSSLTTAVATSNGLVKTVRDVTTGETSGSSSDNGNPGDTLEYSLTFTNTTSGTLSGFVFTDATPTNTTFVSATCGTLPSGVTCAPTGPTVGTAGTVKFTFSGNVAAGATISGLLRVKIN